MQRTAVTLPTTSDDLLAAACERATTLAFLLTGAPAPLDTTMALRQLTDCLQHCAREFTTAGREFEARADAATFVPHDDCMARNRAQLRRLGSLDAVIAAEQALTSPRRFNPARWAQHATSSPDAARLHTLAHDGLHICTPDPFTPSPPATEPRALARRLGDTYFKTMMKQHADHALLVFDPADLSAADHQRLSYIDLHWVPKPSADDRVGHPPRHPGGRLCGDPTNVQGGNSDEAFALCQAAFPPYHLPTLHSILNLLAAAYHRQGLRHA
jgi:hypothetical protein